MRYKLMVVIAVFTMVLIGAGTTQALFNDIENANDNIFQAGSLDIQIGWEESLNNELVEIQEPIDEPGAIFNLTGIQRGDTGEATIEIQNNANPGFLWFSANQTSNIEKTPEREEEEIVCGPIQEFGDTYDAARKTGSNTENIVYEVERTSDISAKFENAEEGLGEDGVEQTDTFNITVDGESDETVYVTTKAGQIVGTARLEGESDVKLDTSGDWKIKIEEIIENNGSTMYMISVTSDSENDTPALSFAEFQFCEPIQQRPYWQIDFTNGSKHVPNSENYSETLVMSALSDSNEDDTLNPSYLNKDRLPEGVELIQNNFTIGDQESTVRFRVEEGYEVNLSHSVYKMPGPFEGTLDEEMDEQELYDSKNKIFGPGEHDFTINKPSATSYEGIDIGSTSLAVETAKACRVNIKSLSADETPVDASGFTTLRIELQNTGETSNVRVNFNSEGELGETVLKEIQKGETRSYTASLSAGDDRNKDDIINSRVVAGPNCEQSDVRQQNFSVVNSEDIAIARTDVTPGSPEIGEQVNFSLDTSQEVEGVEWRLSERTNSNPDWNSFEEEKVSDKRSVTNTYDSAGYYPYLLRITRKDGSTQPYSGHVKVSTEPVQESCPDPNPDGGELGQNLMFTVWHDDGDNIKQEDETVIFNGTAHQLEDSLGEEGKLLDYDPDTAGVQPVPGSESKFIGFKWELPEDAGCEVEMDSKTFDFKFELRQSRHNGDPFLKTFFFGDQEISSENLFQAGNFSDIDQENLETNTEKEETTETETSAEDTGNEKVKKNESLLAYWTLDGSTYKVEDTAQSFDGMNNGARRGVDGKINNSFKFDGSDSVKVESSEDFKLDQGTVSFWVKMDDESSNWMFTRDKYGCEKDCGHLSIAHDSFMAEDKLAVRLQNNGESYKYKLKEDKEIESFEPDKWNHVAVSFGDEGMELYINDKLHDTNNHEGGISGNDLPITIGSRYDGKNGLKGKMDDVRVYNHQLNRSEVAQLYEFRNSNTSSTEADQRSDNLLETESKSLSFDGSQSKRINHSEKLELNEGTLSMSFRINDTSANNWLFAKDDDNCDSDCGHLSVAHNSFINRDGFGVRLQNDGGGSNDVVLTPEEEIKQSKWYNMTVTFGEQGTKLYIDNKLQDESSKTKGITNNDLPVILGHRYDKNEDTGLEGDIKDLKLVGKQLNATEIKEAR